MTSPHRFEVYAGDRLVLHVIDQPGALLGSRPSPPVSGQAPVVHPFVTASAYSVEHEADLRTRLLASVDAGDFLERLRMAGYRVVDCGALG